MTSEMYDVAKEAIRNIRNDTSVEQCQRRLRDAGVLDGKNQIKPAFKGILSKQKTVKNEA